jgi:4-amino-4-deoxychorismate lyase
MLAGIKHLNRLEQVMARAEWGDEFAEGLMLDIDGCLIEGTMSNVFLVQDGVLRTPTLHACGIEGVIRNLVLETAQAMSLPCDIATLTHDDVLQAEEVFLTNSLIGLWPVKLYDWSVAGGGRKEYRVGKITQALQETVQP